LPEWSELSAVERHALLDASDLLLGESALAVVVGLIDPEYLLPAGEPV
jgi:hypothetical protein